jgi:PAS domain-containing protein
VRIRPYVAVENKIDGAVVAFVDIDQVKRSAEQIKHARDRADAIVDTVWQPLAVLDADLRVIRANPAFHRLTHTHTHTSRQGRRRASRCRSSGPVRGPMPGSSGRSARSLGRDSP